MDSINNQIQDNKFKIASGLSYIDLILAAPLAPEQGILCIDLTDGIVRISENLKHILNIRKPSDRLNLESFLFMIDMRDREKIKFHIPENYNADEVLFDEYRISIDEEKNKNFRSYSKLIHLENGQSFIVANISDNTKSREINKAYQEKLAYIDMALDNSIDMFCAFDKNLICIAWNKKCEEITGFLKSEAIGQSALELFPIPRKEKVISGLTAALNGDIAKVFIEEIAPQNLIIEKFIIPLKDNKGRIFGVLIAGHDVTAIKATSNRLKELYQAIKEKNEELERSNNELASFSYIASHDLQEPLRKIQTFSRKILETDHNQLSDSGKDSFRRIENAAQRMQFLINDLLTFSRTNTLPKEFSQTDLNQILYKVKTELREKIESKKAIIISDELPACMVIAFQMRQLLENILNNSLKYSKPDLVPEITIRYKMLEENEFHKDFKNDGTKYFSIIISDNGIGFEQQYAERIFELFQRLHGKHEYPGTGLGLAICKKIVQNHNGFIKAEGEPGKGTKITITLPFFIDTHIKSMTQKAN